MEVQVHPSTTVQHVHQQCVQETFKPRTRDQNELLCGESLISNT